MATRGVILQTAPLQAGDARLTTPGIEQRIVEWLRPATRVGTRDATTAVGVSRLEAASTIWARKSGVKSEARMRQSGRHLATRVKAEHDRPWLLAGEVLGMGCYSALGGEFDLAHGSRLRLRKGELEPRHSGGSRIGATVWRSNVCIAAPTAPSKSAGGLHGRQEPFRVARGRL